MTVDWVFDFHQYEPVLQVTPKYHEIFILALLGGNAKQYSMQFSNVLRSEMHHKAYRKCPTDSSILQNK